MSTSETEQPKTEVDPCTPAVSNIWNLLGKTKACKEKEGKGVATSDTSTTPVETTNLPPEEASNNDEKKPPASNESDESDASGKPADPPTKMGGWFSRGGKRKSKAKKSKRKKRKQKKSRKSRK